MKNFGIIAALIMTLLSTSAFSGEYLIYSKTYYRVGLMTTLPVDNTEACINAIKNISRSFKVNILTDTGNMNYPRTFVCIKSDGEVTKTGQIYAVPSQNNIPCVSWSGFTGWSFDTDRCASRKYELMPVIINVNETMQDLIVQLDKLLRK